MRLEPIDLSTVEPVLLDASGVSGQDETIAELLRAEITARGHCTRASAVRRVLRTVGPARVAIDAAAIYEVCSQLERAGDFQEAQGGILFPTPLRAIDPGTTEWLVAASMPLTWLRAKLPGDWRCDGTVRRCRIDSEQEGGLRAAVAVNGGVVISPEIWAGFDRIPAANAGWILGLDARLQDRPEAAASLERDGALAWSGLIPADDQVRWKYGDEVAQSRLWRTRNQWGYWVYAWTGGGSPSAVNFHELTSDEGVRTVFAIASTMGMPVSAEIEHRDGFSVVSVSHWLPSAEYRFLAASSSPGQNRITLGGWAVPHERVGAVVEVLRNRLGVAVREGQRS